MSDTDFIARGPHHPPLREDTIGQALDEAARRWGDREALVSVHQGIRWTYAELKARAEALAGGLLALGLAPGDRIGIWSPNKAEWALTQFAAAKAGLILVTINPAYRLSEVEYTLNKVGVRVLVCAESFKTSAYADMIAELAPEIARSTPGALSAARLAPSRRWAGRRRRSDWRGSRRRWTGAIRSTSSSPAAPPACRRARPCRTGTSSTTASSSARRSG